MLLEIISGAHPNIDECDVERVKDWEFRTKRGASSSINCLANVGFTVGRFILCSLFHPPAGIAQELQLQNFDIIPPFKNIHSLISGMESV